jgi:hypothetical protein
MPPPISPYAALRVRTNPFSHELTIAGQPVRFDYLQGALAPHEHAWHLNYFFDIYKWVDHEQLGKLACGPRHPCASVDRYSCGAAKAFRHSRQYERWPED